MKKKNKQFNVSTKIAFSFTVITILVAIIFYFLLTSLLNYPPNTINTQFDKEVSNLYYVYQYLIAISGIILLFIVYFKISLNKIDKWIKNKNIKEIPEIRRICFTYPYKMFITIEIFPVIIVLLTLALTGSHPLILLFKIGILVFSFATLVSSIFLLISKNIFYPILKETSKYVKKEKFSEKDSLQRRLVFQIFPVILVTILLMALIGYSRLISEKGELLSVYYKAELDSLDIQAYNDILEQVKNQIGDKLLSKNDYIFLESPNGEIESTNKNKPSEFFIKYMEVLSPTYDNRVYEAYTIDEQGVIKYFEQDNQIYTIGIHYEIVSSSLLMYILFAATILFGFNLIIIICVTKSIDSDLNKLTDSLTSLCIDENHKDISESEALKLAHKIVNDLSKKQGIIIPNEENLVSKMINELNKYNDSLIEMPRKIVVSSKNNLVNAVKTNSDNQFEVNVEGLVLENLKSLKALDDKEEKHVNTGKIIDNIITHINFKNCNNLEYAKIENEVEKIVEKMLMNLFQLMKILCKHQ